MKKFSTTKLALTTLVCAFALCPSARAQDSKAGEAVRERRASTTEASDASKTAQADKTAGAAPSSTSKSSSAAASQPVAGDGVEELKAQIASASNPSERGRLRQTLAARLADSGNKAEAVELLRSMLAEERFDPSFFYNTGNALARLGESNAAVEAYRKAISQRHGNYSRAENNLGVVLMRLGRWDESEEALTNALKLENYNYAEASYSLGRLHALRGEAGLAIAEWRRTLRLDPKHADAAVALARALAEDGDPAQALAVLDSFTSRSGATVPREVAIARGEIVAAANVAAEEKGERRSTEIVEASKPLPASRADKNSEPEKISPSYSRDARASSKSLRPLVVGREAYSLLMNARDARAENHEEAAVALYRKAIEANGGYFAPANIELGYTLTGLHRNEEAAASLLVVLRKEGAQYPVAYYHLGRIYEHLGRVEEAGDAFARAAELMGATSPQFFVDVSRVREREGRYDDALAAAEQYVRLMAQTGGVPDWAGERVNSLRKKVEQNATRPAKN
ncbi:MAG TPA: tetratricopeptide repeat protein [Pyrinomonadaceae bacterium]|nr:tetratricopeptide repeat protein [Pyrinomonadaceae bacterium]